MVLVSSTEQGSKMDQEILKWVEDACLLFKMHEKCLLKDVGTWNKRALEMIERHEVMTWTAGATQVGVALCQQRRSMSTVED